jgi:hypothetical protein
MIAFSLMGMNKAWQEADDMWRLAEIACLNDRNVILQSNVV